MKGSRNSQSFKNAFAGFDTTLRHYIVERPRAQLELIRRRFRDLPKTNFDLGVQFAGQNKWQDAIFRFKLAIYLQPNFAQAYYNLGCCYMRTNKYPQARTAFKKALALQPDHRDAIMMLSAVEPEAVPDSMLPKRLPKHMVAGFFAQAAATYDQLEQVNQYNGPKVMFDALRPYVREGKLNVLDAGCGTGLCARAWRAHAAEMTGLDFTPEMVGIAGGARVADKPLFERVIDADLAELGEHTVPPLSADVILVCNVAQFVGELSGMMKALTAALKPGGILGITIETGNAPKGYALNPATGRFVHATDYVKQLAIANALELKRDGRVNLYPELQAHLFILGKRA